MAQKKPVKRLKKGGDSPGGGGRGGRGGRGGGGGSNKPGSTQASGDGSNKPGGGGPSGGFSSAGKSLGGGGGGGNIAAPGGGGSIVTPSGAPSGGGGIGGISVPAGGFGGEALPPGVSPQAAASAVAQLTGGKVDLRGIAGVPRGPGAPLARDVLTKQGPQGVPTPSMPLDLPQPGVLPQFDPRLSPVTNLTPEQIAEIEAGALATRMDYALPDLAPDAVFTRPMMNPEGLPLQGPPMPPGMAPPDAVTYVPLPGETPESFEAREAAREIMERYGMETALDRPTPVSRPVTSAPVSAPPPMQRPEQRYTPAPDVTPAPTPIPTPTTRPVMRPTPAAVPDPIPTMRPEMRPTPAAVPAPIPTMRPEMRPTAVPAPIPMAPAPEERTLPVMDLGTPTTPVAPTPATPPATPALTPGLPASAVEADALEAAAGVHPRAFAPMGGGLLALGLNALNPLMRGSGRGLFGGGERMTADQIFAREAEMSRGGDGGMAMSGSPTPPLIPPLTPAPVAPVTPTFTPPVYTPPPPPTPTRGYQSYFDLMRARNQPGIIPGLAGGGMVQPSMTNAFTPGSYYAAYDPRRRGLGGM